MGIPVLVLSMFVYMGAPPLDTTGLILRLESDSGVVTTGSTVTAWNDQSPLGNNLTAGGAPTLAPGVLNGNPAIQFDGIDDKLDRNVFMGLPTGSGSNRTLFLVVRYNSTGPGGFSFGDPTCNDAFGLIVRPPLGDLMVTGYCTSADQGTAEPGTGSGWMIQSVILDASVQRHYRDGRRIDSGFFNYSTTNSKVVIGAEVGSFLYTDMEVGAALVYNYAVSDTTHANVVAYLKDKYLTDATPAAADDYVRMNRTSNTTIDVTANDDARSAVDPTTVTIVAPPASGVASVDPVTGVISYTHWAIDMKPDSLTYTVESVGGLTSTPATVWIAIDDPGCPLLTNNLALHLDAGIGVRLNAGSVHSWTDLSTERNDMEAYGGPTVTAGALNGHNVVSFDGIDDKLDRISGLDGFAFGFSNRSVFAVINYQGFGTAGVMYGDTYCNGVFGLTTQPNGNLMLTGWCPVNDYPTTTQGTGAGWLVQSAVTDGGWFEHSVDGVPLTNLMHTYGTSGQRFLVGAEMTGSTHVQMQVAEILVYGEALTVAERNQVVDHLRAKYFDEFCSVPCLPPQIATDPLPDTLCIGDPLTVDVAATGTPPLFYQWSLDGVPIPGATSATYSVAGAALVDAGLYDVVVTNACGTATSAAVEVVVQSPLAVTLQPSAQSACPGSSPSFTVAATGSGPIFYQWRFNGTPIGGATAATLNLTNIAAGDVGNYDVVLTNPCGTATSVAVALSLLDPVAIQVQPVPQIGCLGSSVTMNVTATGTGLTYQWRKNGTPIAGATGSSFSLTNLTLSDADVYDVSVIGTCNTVNSSVVTVSVTTPASITTGPSPAVTCPGDNVMFSVTPAGSPPFFYEWRKDGAAIPGETGLTLTIPAATSGDSGDYTVVVSNSCGSQTSTPALLTVLADPAFDVVPGNTFACLGGTTNLTAAATGPAPLTFQWFKDGNPIPAATSTTLVLSPVVATDAGSYSIAVTSSCTTVTSQTFDVSVDSLPQIVTPPQPLTTCENFTTDFTVVADSVSPLTYQWRKNGFDIVGATTATYSIATTTPADAGSYDVVVTNACNFVTTLPVQLTVSPGTLCDCNMNGMLDSDDLATGASNDCNENGIPDECDIASGTSLDDDMNGIPDDCGFFDRGDCNIDSSFNIADVIFLLGFSFPGPLGPNDLQCKDACDCNDDGGLNIADAICFLGFLFGNPPIIPAAPFGACGVDPTDNDSLDCLEFPCP